MSRFCLVFCSRFSMISMESCKVRTHDRVSHSVQSHVRCTQALRRPLPRPLWWGRQRDRCAPSG